MWYLEEHIVGTRKYLLNEWLPRPYVAWPLLTVGALLEAVFCSVFLLFYPSLPPFFRVPKRVKSLPGSGALPSYLPCPWNALAPLSEGCFLLAIQDLAERCYLLARPSLNTSSKVDSLCDPVSYCLHCFPPRDLTESVFII